MITKYQAMMATLPVRSVSCEIQAVEDRVRVLRHSLFMLEEAGMLDTLDCHEIAKPLYELEEQVYELLCAVNGVEDLLVTHARMASKEEMADLAAFLKQHSTIFGE